jgi:serine protease
MSLGSQGSCTPAYQAVVSDLVAAGVTIVAAAGNDTGLKVSVPANCNGVIAVSGVRHAGTKVGYSNIGPEVSIAAPAGNCVNLEGPCLYPLLTTVNLGARSAGVNGYSDSSNYTVGTSFASPLVAGTVALMLSVDETLTPSGIRDILRNTARAFPSTGAAADVVACRAPDTQDQLECYCTTSTCGAGLLDSSAAVARVVALKPPVVPNTPVVITAPSGGSGGGGSGLWWLLGLLCGTATLHALRRRDALRCGDSLRCRGR